MMLAVIVRPLQYSKGSKAMRPLECLLRCMPSRNWEVQEIVLALAGSSRRLRGLLLMSPVNRKDVDRIYSGL